MTYYFYFFVGKFPKFFNFSDIMEKIYLVELNKVKENALHGLQKIPLDNFPRNIYIWSAIVCGACMQKLKIGHRANFRAKNKCFRQILYPVRAILRSINFRYADFNTDSADACILVMAWTRVKNAVRMRVFPASGAYLPLKLYAITKQTRFRPRNSKK